MCSKLTIKIPERLHWRHSGVFIVNFELYFTTFLLFLWMTLNKDVLAGYLTDYLKLIPRKFEISKCMCDYIKRGP